ncbi:hypothetical protein I3679_019140 [Proteus mirabilis]|uniref:Uncharacterized protein n=1 Tax=Proteus mirabilis TaxID=584 RepID=A0ABD5LYJ4_PROMI
MENYEQIDSVVYWDNKIRNLLPVALQAKKYKPELAIILHSHLPYDVLFAVMAGCQYILRNTSDIIPKWFQNGLLLIIIQLEVMLFKVNLILLVI